MLTTLLSAAAALASLVLSILLYELLRASVLRAFRLRLERDVSRFLSTHGVRLDRFRFTQKPWIRQTLLDDADLAAFSVERARAEGQGVEAIRARIEAYIEEIVPYFNLLSYYKLGFGVARPAMNLLYDVAPDRRSLAAAALDPLPSRAVVYVMNHRSNADYVLFAYVMSRSVALSYAVGEWARVWPLEWLFKSFGSYFVRRGEKDPLYHEVLRRYVNLIARGGLCQGIFLEGGLSRDGALRTPKVGLMDALIEGAVGDGGDVVFVPVGLNFDRVLEDRNLLREAGGGGAPGPKERARSFGRILTKLPSMLGRRLARVLKGALRAVDRGGLEGGVAAVSAGSPVSAQQWFGPEWAVLPRLPRADRRKRMDAFAAHLMGRIAAVIPATPVPLLCDALLRRADAQHTAGRTDLADHIARTIAALRGAGRPVQLGTRVDRAAPEGTPGADEERKVLSDLDAEIGESALGEAVLDAALAVLGPRGVIRREGTRLAFAEADASLLRYYAATLPPTQ